MTLNEYLNKHYQPSTVKIYLFEIRHYLNWMGEQHAESASYSDVLHYLEYLRKRYDSSGTVYRIVYAIKRYYYYLQAIEKRQDHPCRLL
jgi:integrase/recombinase XerD